MLWYGFHCVVFFFQAEDGIRDGTVTGVQTCALPICPALRPSSTCRLSGHTPLPCRHTRRRSGVAHRAVSARPAAHAERSDRKSTRLNSSHSSISYAVFCLKKKKNKRHTGSFVR